jgi:hypothetical protein
MNSIVSYIAHVNVMNHMTSIIPGKKALPKVPSSAIVDCPRMVEKRPTQLLYQYASDPHIPSAFATPAKQ